MPVLAHLPDSVRRYRIKLRSGWRRFLALTIGQLAEEAGVGVQTVRFYQGKGLVPEPARQETRHRRYAPETISRIRFFRDAQDLGFSPREIEDVMGLRVTPGTSKAEIKARAEAKVAEIERKMGDLHRMRGTLIKLIGACGGSGSLEDRPILEALDRKASCDNKAHSRVRAVPAGWPAMA